jgi:PadR family transcriptional regulator PadR
MYSIMQRKVLNIDSQLKKGIIEYFVLAVLNNKDSYGYEIVKSISNHLPITESTLYPILKRLEKQEKVQTYSKEYNGRLRKYYEITEAGLASIYDFLNNWSQMEDIHDFIKRSVNE